MGGSGMRLGDTGAGGRRRDRKTNERATTREDPAGVRDETEREDEEGRAGEIQRRGETWAGRELPHGPGRAISGSVREAVRRRGRRARLAPVAQ